MSELLTISEAAKRLNVSRYTLSKLVDLQQITPINVGTCQRKYYRFPVYEIDRFIHERCQPPEPKPARKKRMPVKPKKTFFPKAAEANRR